jgi:hemoglobin
MSPPLPLAAPTHVQANPHYDRIGGRVAIENLVQAFYRAMDQRPEAATIRAMHAADLHETQQVLANYLTEWMGGPKAYSPERGAPMLRRRHQPFEIDEAARQAWMACMHQALLQTCSDDALRQELEAAFAKVAHAVVNTPSTSR